MMYLIFILISLVLFVSFFVLTKIEARRGMRFFAQSREQLDQYVGRVEFVFTHVDLASFLREEFEMLMHRLGHDIAHLSLQTVRAVERFLARLVRQMRSKDAATPGTLPRETSREFVKTLADFKGQLEATRPEMSEVR